MEKPVRVDREHPRYERAVVRPSVNHVLRVLAKRYGVEVDDLMNGRRGKDNEARKIGMYLAKELCDMKLTEIAGQFGAGGYGRVGWACHGVATRMEADANFRKRVSSIRRIANKRFDS